jgi:hypothetical protein
LGTTMEKKKREEKKNDAKIGIICSKDMREIEEILKRGTCIETFRNINYSHGRGYIWKELYI